MPASNPIARTSYPWGQVEIYGDKAALGAAAAEFVAARLREAIAARGAARLILATGASQYEFLAALRTQADVAWPRVTVFHLDEYLGMDDRHPASFRRYLRERVFDHLPFGQVHLLAGDAADPAAECARYAALLDEAAVDIACIGIGENGHLAFNDPPADFETSAAVHIVQLDEACRRQQVGEGHFATLADVPTRALSLTIPAILAARAISCVVPDRRKAEAVRCTLAGPITPACPASALRTHTDVRLYLDRESAALVG
ncbi:MAG: Glucosamine-6-phosphate deaminase 1 [Chloroflexi bacterium ADurb.Bin325]|nr:MAG: Glucosamine-6-phosphate deaminase 1 [Chloroflexi bacterium ADurb.Bin325]